MTADTDPITLAEACETIFRGSMTVATLRAEAARGKLAIFKIGRRIYTTQASVREMIALCRVAPKDRGCISIAKETNTSSETVRLSCVQAALDTKLRELKSSLPNISSRNTDRRPARHR